MNDPDRQSRQRRLEKPRTSLVQPPLLANCQPPYAQRDEEHEDSDKLQNNMCERSISHQKMNGNKKCACQHEAVSDGCW